MSTTGTRLGFALGGDMTAPEMVECVVHAESLGYDSAWIAEGHGGDQFAILAACATQTHRIRLGTSISSVFVRSIPTIAMAAATVDALSNRRFVLGLGSSHRVQVGPEHGVAYSKPLTRVRESVECIRTLLREGRVDGFRGETFQIEHFDLWFEPARREIPIYLSALFPKMLELTGEVAQGVILARTTIDSVSEVAAHIEAGAARAGRGADAIEISTLLPTCVAGSEREAIDILRPGVAFYAGFFPRYNRLIAESGFPEAAAQIRAAWDRGDRDGAARAVPDAVITETCVAGTPPECAARIEAYRRAGVDLPILSLRSGGKEGVMAALSACAP